MTRTTMTPGSRWAQLSRLASWAMAYSLRAAMRWEMAAIVLDVWISTGCQSDTFGMGCFAAMHREDSQLAMLERKHESTEHHSGLGGGSAANAPSTRNSTQAESNIGSVRSCGNSSKTSQLGPAKQRYRAYLLIERVLCRSGVESWDIIEALEAVGRRGSWSADLHRTSRQR